MTNAALNAETCSMLAPAGIWWQEAKGIWKDQQEHWKRLSWTLAHPGMTTLMFTEGTNYSYLLLNLSDSWVLIPTAGILTPDKDTTTRSFILKFPTEDRQVLIVQPYSYHHPRTENSDQGQRWRRSRSNKLTPCPWALVLISASDTSFWVTWIPFFAETTCQFCFHHTRVYISQEQFLGDIRQKARPPLDPDKKSPSSLVFLPQPFQGPSVCKRKSPYSFMEIILWVPRTAKFPI